MAEALEGYCAGYRGVLSTTYRRIDLMNLAIDCWPTAYSSTLGVKRKRGGSLRQYPGATAHPERSRKLIPTKTAQRKNPAVVSIQPENRDTTKSSEPGDLKPYPVEISERE
jgi:hypothetical protein